MEPYQLNVKHVVCSIELKNYASVMKMNDIELYENILKQMIDVTENGDLFREEIEDRYLVGELQFLHNIIIMMLDSIPEKKLAYDLWKGLQTRLVEE